MADYVLIAALLIFACAFYIFLGFSKADGQLVEIRQGAELVSAFQLSVNTEFELRDDNGILLNVIEISGGEVCVKYANCQDQTCVVQGKISKTREAIVCLPNLVVVEVMGNQVGFDAIVK